MTLKWCANMQWIPWYILYKYVDPMVTVSLLAFWIMGAITSC